MKKLTRIAWLKIALVFNFILGIIFAKNLWFSARTYPLTPAFAFLSGIPSWIDYFLTPILILTLIFIAISPKPRKYIAIALALIAFLFLQDQGRVFPSFYEYSFLLFALGFYGWHDANAESADGGTAEAILNACRVAIVFVYIWSGIQKMNPLFVNDFSFFLLPLSGPLVFVRRVIPALLVIAPFIEVWIGAGLLFRLTRKYALGTALLMHAGIFFLIGPIRGNWNDSAWAWDLGSALLVFILFFRADDVPAKKILFNKDLLLHQVVFVFFALMPMLSLFNLWDSALSFDVYSGNYFQAQIYVTKNLAQQLPASVQKYILNTGATPSDLELVNLAGWSEDEFNANPYPAARVFKNIAGSFCEYAETPEDVRLIITDKLKLSSSLAWTGGNQSYDCAAL